MAIWNGYATGQRLVAEKIVQELIASGVSDGIDRQLRLPPSPPSSDLTTQLERLKALHDQGALSDEEFKVAKAKLLETATP
jgi:hypothetical protein